ncbi:MAG: MAE_28990/MAE_18760 family HEPN-like nuclease [Myxococcota bacterium]
MALSREQVVEEIANCLDRRRKGLTETERVALALQDNVLFQAASLMAIPMFYAHWEGFAKEVLQHYIEYVEGRSVPMKEVETSLLAYAWTGSFRKLSGTLTHERKKELIERFLSTLSSPIAFDQAEKDIDTGSNLFFGVLKGLFECLCLDIGRMREHEKKLNGLVNRRNNIAHGGRVQKLTQSDVHEYHDLVLQLMGELESTLLEAIGKDVFIRPGARVISAVGG